MELLKYLKINKYANKIHVSNLITLKFIYSLKLIELETFKLY